jgi:dihydrofolate reductase
MGKIVITTNMSLDGVIEDPDGKEGCETGDWFNTYGADDLGAWAELETAEALEARAMLLGRRSDEWFAARWTARTGAWADQLNGLPKYVVSATLQTPQWTNATVLDGNVAELAAVKDSIDGEILVYASYQLVQTLLEHGLADELRLVIFPVVLGAGRRLFGSMSNPAPLRLRESRPLGNGLTFVRYEIAPVPSTP